MDGPVQHCLRKRLGAEIQPPDGTSDHCRPRRSTPRANPPVLGALARAGQHSRFVDGYLKPYARAFDEIRYFSYLAESLAEYTDDQEVRASVRLLAGARWHPWAYACAMPLRYGQELRTCSVLRVFQVTG